jgi:6-phosphofructokinase 1
MRELLDFTLDRLGPCTVSSPMTGISFVAPEDSVLYASKLSVLQPYLDQGLPLPTMEMAGPRAKLFFDPSFVKAGIVTCGGLCPGLNDVIRALTLSLRFHYGVETVYGFRYGYQGLNPDYGKEPMLLTPARVDTIGELGGTILGSSRGPQDVGVMVDTLERLEIRILFTIGGDGTLRGARAIADEIAARGSKISVIGIPKTIDNDISFIQQSFGFQTAASIAHEAVAAANVEATGAPNGIGLVKLMGRESGFIAAYTSLVDSMVNFCLIPEVPFHLDRFLGELDKRIAQRSHAVIAVAEGAGQNLFEGSLGLDASGNRKLGDVGLFLRDAIKAYFVASGTEISMKYIDPSYMIRSVPANAFDSAYCLLLGHNAVHAGMAGFTNTVVGNWNDEFTLVPIDMAVSARKKVDPTGRLWNSVLASTGQPADLT